MPPPLAGIVKSFNKGSMPSDEWFGAQAVYRISLGNLVRKFLVSLAPLAVHQPLATVRDTFEPV